MYTHFSSDIFKASNKQGEIVHDVMLGYYACDKACNLDALCSRGYSDAGTIKSNLAMYKTTHLPLQ